MSAVLGMEAEIPGLDEDFSMLDKIQNTLDVLREYEVSFVDQKTVCQAQIRTLVEKYSVSLDERYPVASFTARPSGQNFEVAQEALGGGIASTIGKYIKKSLEILGKIFKWIFDAVTGLFKRNKDIDKQVNNIQAIHETNENLGAFLNDQKANQDELDKAVDIYNTKFSELSRVMLNDSDLLGALRITSFDLTGVFEVLNKRVGVLKECFSKNPSNNELRRNFSKIEGQTSVNILSPKALKLVDSEPESIFEYFEDLKNQIRTWQNDKEGKAIDWEVASKIVTNPSSTMSEPVFPNVNTFFKDSKKLQDRTTALDWNGVAGSKELAKEAQRVLKVTISDANACLQFAQLAKVVMFEQINLIGYIYNCEMAQYNLYITQGKKAKDKETIQKINELHAKLKENLI